MLNTVEHFTYLTSATSIDSHSQQLLWMPTEVKWKNHSLGLSTKILVYTAVVFTTLLYESEA